MGLIDQILGRSDKPEPPAELKKLINSLAGSLSATLAGKPCPNCGKVHDLKAMVLGSPQAQPYEESDGLDNEYEYVPKSMEAIQFLPHNVPDVMEFLFDRSITFTYLQSPSNGEDQILLPNLASEEIDEGTEVLVYGKWVAVTGDRAGKDIGYSAVADAEFRSNFQLTVKGPTPAAAVVDQMDGDKLLKDAERDALDAYGDE